ncbi:MAG TPA: prepilin-type N-terminal cleavage/methylation domain-containing protein [Candidatus Saccharimonadia bacterium]|nr:prepilin-type N-terminal cleavage/methylation domain-containing protein [Candidatus Saccharimonadia bacterium]
MKSAGFTLVEVLLSVAIITMLTGLSLPLYESFVRRNDLDLTTQSIATMIRRAETYSRGTKSDSTWGVEFQSTNAILFRGSMFASRDTSYDEMVTIPVSITPSGLSELTFTKLTGAPNTTGSLTLASTTNTTKTITINAKGTVDY